MTNTDKTYGIPRDGAGGLGFYTEDGSARSVAVPGVGSSITTFAAAPGGPTGAWSSTENPDTFSGFGQPPSGTFTTTEAADSMTFSGWVSREPDNPVLSYVYCYSSGDRLVTSIDSAGNSLIDTVTTNLAGAAQFADFNTAFNGHEGTNGGANGPYYGGTPTATETAIVWHFNQGGGVLPGAAIINGLRFAQSGGGTFPQDWGIWALLGSEDGANYFLLQEIELTNTSTGYKDDTGAFSAAGSTFDFGGDNIIANIPWEYFAFVWEGGNWVGGRLATGLDFQAFANPNAVGHTATVTIGGGLTVDVGGSPPNTEQNWQDGLFVFSYPDNSTGLIPTLNGLTNGSYVTFDWGAGKYIAPFRFRINNTTPQNYGTCQWSGSNDGITFTNVGSTFSLTMGNQEDAVFDIDNPTREFYQMWRLTFVSTTQSQILGWAEVVFDMESQSYNIMRVTENPDTFFCEGYVGAFGVTGQFTPTENTDTFAAVGHIPDIGAWASIEAQDHFSAYGYQPTNGHWTSTEATDKFAATGLGRGVNGAWVSTEDVDIFSATGYTPIAGTWASTENADIFQAVSSGVTVIKKRRVFFVS